MGRDCNGYSSHILLGKHRRRFLWNQLGIPVKLSECPYEVVWHHIPGEKSLLLFGSSSCASVST